MIHFDDCAENFSDGWGDSTTKWYRKRRHFGAIGRSKLIGVSKLGALKPRFLGDLYWDVHGSPYISRL